MRRSFMADARRWPSLAGMAALLAAVAVAPPAAAQGARTQSYLDTLIPDVTVKGRLKADPAGNLTLAPESDKSVRIPIVNPTAAPNTLQGVPLTVQVRRQGNAVSIQSATLPAIDQWRKQRDELASKHPNLMAPFTQLERRTVDLVQPQPTFLPGPAPVAATSAQLRAFNDDALIAEDAIIEAFLTLQPGDVDARNRLIDLFRETVRTRKALYGRSDLYRPLVYQRIHEASRSIVAVVEKNPDRVRCSGVLIGPSIVLTARHCITGLIVSAELKVWFNFEKDLAEPPNSFTVASFNAKELVLEGGPLPHPGAGRLDFALLRLLPDAQNHAAGDSFAPRCLSADRARYDQPLYVVGHPRGEERTVHDNGWVIFPFMVTREDYGRLLIGVETEFQNSPDRDDAVKTFTDSYVKSTEGGVDVYRNFSARWNFQPTIGVEIDTFHGNSGGPAFGRVDQKVVGIVINGEPDQADPWTPGWRRHEAILPASQIIDDVQAQQPALINGGEIQVCVP